LGKITVLIVSSYCGRLKKKKNRKIRNSEILAFISEVEIFHQGIYRGCLIYINLLFIDIFVNKSFKNKKLFFFLIVTIHRLNRFNIHARKNYSLLRIFIHDERVFTHWLTFLYVVAPKYFFCNIHYFFCYAVHTDYTQASCGRVFNLFEGSPSCTPSLSQSREGKNRQGKCCNASFQGQDSLRGPKIH